jgi:hypothetical protein
MKRIDHAHRLDLDAEVGEWDYFEELIPPGTTFDPEPAPHGVHFAHRPGAPERTFSPEFMLCWGVEMYYREH